MGRLRYEAGQTVVLLAVMLPLLLGLGAITVDIGYWYVVKKTAQDAADAAALAAARELPDPDEAEATAITYVKANMPNASWEVEFPYIPSSADVGVSDGGVPDYTKIEVTVTHATGTFFGQLFGLIAPTVSRRAVAERLDSPGNLAIFAHDEPDCGDGLGAEFDGKNISINGLIHSNSRFRISTGPFWAADGTISRNNCTSSIEQGVYSQFGDAPPLNSEPRDIFETLEWPAWFTPAQFGWFSRCTYKGSTIELTAQQVITTQPDQAIDHNGTIPSGTYCATESFTLTGDGLRGALTALAPEITIEGSNSELRPFSGDVLFFAVPNTDFDPGNDGALAAGGNPDCQPSPAADLWLDGSGHNWRGLIFSPCGRIVVNTGGGTTALVGTIVGHQVRVDADGFEMIGRSDFEFHTALVE